MSDYLEMNLDPIRDRNIVDTKFIIKRNGTKVPFEAIKIKTAISKAAKEEKRVDLTLSEKDIEDIVEIITSIVFHSERALSVEEIQDLVEREINKRSYEVFVLYHDYRMNHTKKREMSTLDEKITGIIDVRVNEDGSVSGTNEEVKQENSNKNPTVNSVQRDYIAGEVSRNYSDNYLLPEDIKAAHKQGILHFHDADYFIQHMSNCCLVNLEDMLQNGTVITETMIEKPHSFSTACNIATQVIAQVASSQYGGQSISLAHLAPFVQVSRDKFIKQIKKEGELAGIKYTDEEIKAIAESRVLEEINRGVQMIQYQILTLMTTNGQTPFVTVFMYLNEAKEGQTRDDLALIIKEVLKQRIQGVKNEKGVYITPAFPKLIYVLEEDNIHEGSKYWELTKLAAKCTAKRMVPDYISEKVMKELKDGNCYPSMGCRSLLSPYKDENGNYKFYGRFNQGVVTLNLVDVACSSGKDMNKFWNILDERLELCHKALRIRHERLLGTPSDVAPILWQYGALARLKKGETIDKLLYNGYSTLSLGYAGLAECTYYMFGCYHTEEKEAHDFAINVMKRMNEFCEKWKAAENIDYSIYGTPLESTTYKFAKCLQRRFGIIKNVTDHDYITNSYHICVREKVDAFTKLTKESEFQKLSTGGAISYVEIPNMQNNIPAVLAIMQHIYNTIIYAELNTKSDYCEVCGYDGEIRIVKDEDGTLVWECPNCGNRNQDKMSVARRTCGYIGTQFWNQGRTQEISQRELHVAIPLNNSDNADLNANASK